MSEPLHVFPRIAMSKYWISFVLELNLDPQKQQVCCTLKSLSRVSLTCDILFAKRLLRLTHLRCRSGARGRRGDFAFLPKFPGRQPERPFYRILTRPCTRVFMRVKTQPESSERLYQYAERRRAVQPRAVLYLSSRGRTAHRRPLGMSISLS